jgi:tetratricopeptide (TPR) repeat protein
VRASSILPLLLLAFPLVAHGQDEALDADPRPYDKVFVKGMEGPIEGTIQDRDDTGSKMLTIKKKGETVTIAVDRATVERIVPKQTPIDALRERAERIKAGSAEEHRKLGDWAWRSGLEPEALGEIRKAVLAATQPQASVPQRARLARLLLWRALKTDGDERDDLYEEILTLAARSEKLGAGSPEIELAVGRVLLAQGMTAPAIPHLEKARAALATEASGPPVSEPPPPAASPDKPDKPEKAPDKTPDKTPEKKDGTRPVGGGRRGDRDGEGGPRDKKPAPKAPDPVPTEDHGAEVWPGITNERRLVFRDVLLALGEALVKTDRPEDAIDALGPLALAYPQDRVGLPLRAQARLQSGDSRGAAQDLTQALGGAPDDAALLRDRGIASYGAGDLDAAKTDLERAVAGSLEDPRSAQAHLGLVLIRMGKWKAAADALTKADQTPDPAGAVGYGLAKLGLGVLAELQGKPDVAAGLYEDARTLVEKDGLVSYSVAMARLRGQKLDEARTSLRDALRVGLPFPVGARALAAIARAQSRPKDEVRALEELVASIDGPAGADDLYALGRAYVGIDRIDDARLSFDRAIAAVATHVPALLGAGYVRYVKDDRDAAKDFFERALAIEKDSAYARRALKNLEDARTRRVWVDRFDRDAGDVKNGWVADQGFGVEVAIKGGKLSFSGTQQRDTDGGKTRLARDILNQQAVKLEATLNLANAGDARCGIRFETERGGAILFRDKDDILQAAVSASGNKNWADPKPLGAWPKDGRSHVIAIEVEDPAQGIVSFWLDGERKPEIAKIQGLAKSTGRVQVAVFGAAPIGSQYGFTVDEVRVYARRPDDGSASKGGGGF